VTKQHLSENEMPFPEGGIGWEKLGLCTEETDGGEPTKRFIAAIALKAKADERCEGTPDLANEGSASIPFHRVRKNTPFYHN
jgi:hypothetical protein